MSTHKPLAAPVWMTDQEAWAWGFGAKMGIREMQACTILALIKAGMKDAAALVANIDLEAKVEHQGRP